MVESTGPSRNLSVGDECPNCGREITETTGGGLLAYCWWCNDRNRGDDTVTTSDTEKGGLYQPAERENCGRCNGMGVITERLNGPDWCPDCDGSGYLGGWPDYVEREVDAESDH